MVTLTELGMLLTLYMATNDATEQQRLLDLLDRGSDEIDFSELDGKTGPFVMSIDCTKTVPCLDC
jgi:hypothetical protein